MKEMTLDGFLRDRDMRIKRAGIVFTGKFDEKLRNKGSRRTREKREMLRLIDGRCGAAGVTPLKAYYQDRQRHRCCGR